MLSFIKFIHKEKCAIVKKQKKKRKNVNYESLSSINLAYDGFVLELWY